MSFVFTWAIPNTPYEISCVAENRDDATRKAIDVIQQLDGVSKLTDHLTEKRLDLIKQLHSANSDSDEEEKSACAPPSKKTIHKQIHRLNKEIEEYRSKVQANLFVGTVPLTSFSYTKSDGELSLVHLVIKTDPTVVPFYAVTIKRNDVATIA
jgi:hypothetical protein